MKATRGSTLGLSLVPFVCVSLVGLAVTSVIAQDDIPGVGLGTVTPICDALVSECISSDEEVQDELIAELEADDQVTAVRQVIELGEVLCDTLDGAENEELLRFVMSSTETVTAQRSSLTVVDANVFSDASERKVWKGDVIDPAPADGSIPRTMSMTWGTPCDVQTFLLKMIDYNDDGTTSITTSVPCDAGTSGEICMIQYDIDLPNASEPETPPAKDEETDISVEARRSLALPSNSRVPSRGLKVDASATKRRLEAMTEIDVMVLYSDASLGRFFGGATAAQMETLIADELPKATEAATNSEINLQFNLVHTGLAAVGAAAASSELSILRADPDVNTLRNTYAADLVVLVGSFAGTCGLGYVNFDTDAGDESYGFSLIDALCFDSKSTTHEMGHNLGCLHDLDNNSLTPVNDYSHGQRYCTGTDTRFHTIMAYYCVYNPPTGYVGDFVPGINYFSNPNVNYNGRATGTATKNNARTITENMEAVSNFRRPCLVDADCEDYGTCADGVCGFTLCESVGGNPAFSGSGFCSPGNNNAECGYDGGDCCECDCTNGGSVCGVNGYNCLNPYSECGPDPNACDVDGDCDTGGGEICCPTKKVCEQPLDSDPTACGDPHMTGFLGQKFDFTGVDGEWYCLIKDENIQVSMRVTSPVPSLPEITYITGLSVVTTDAEGSEHDIVIAVADPHSLKSSCPEGVWPCLADGSLTILLDGEEELLAPGTVSLGQDVVVSAVNLPGECRSFGFETYWERKGNESATLGRRLLGKEMAMGEWILADPTVTNMEECAEYVTSALANAGGLFTHQSEHATFQIVTLKATIRLSHGRLHQAATRDPTDHFDLPDHTTWQMNMAIDHNAVSRTATGILGETLIPTLDAAGNAIMFGMESIRGGQEDYLLGGPLETEFAQDSHVI